MKVFLSLTIGILILYACNSLVNGNKCKDFVDFQKKVKTGDLIFIANKTDDEALNFNHYGIIEKSGSRLYVWDNRNTLKMSLCKWANTNTNTKVKVKVFRPQTVDFDLKNVVKENDNYNEIMNVEVLTYVIET